MLSTKLRVLLILIIAVFIGIIYGVLHHPPGYFLSLVSRSPLSAFIHYEWDISDTKDESVKALLVTEHGKFIIKITGEGRMVDFTGEENRSAWHDLQNMNTGWYFLPDEIMIKDGVTYIGDYAFPDFSSIEEVWLPISLKEIGHGAFLNCTSLSRIIFAGTVREWEQVVCGEEWRTGSKIFEIECTDGIFTLNGQ